MVKILVALDVRPLDPVGCKGRMGWNRDPGGFSVFASSSMTVISCFFSMSRVTLRAVSRVVLLCIDMENNANNKMNNLWPNYLVAPRIFILMGPCRGLPATLRP